jgi:spore coat-associated protein N
MIPRRILTALGTVLVAAAVASGSGADFNAVSSNPGTTITAGIVKLTNQKNGSAVLTVSALSPGHSDSATTDLTNSGDLAGDLSLLAGDVSDTPSAPALSSKLDLVVTDLGDPACTSACLAATTVYSGKLGGLTRQSVAALSPLATHRLKFTVTFPDGGPGADNAYQRARTAVDITWTLAQR